MTLLLDTSILVDLEKGRKQTKKEIRSISELHQSPAKITFITEFEVLYGLKDKNEKNKNIILKSLQDYGVIHTSQRTARILSNLKIKYEEDGLIIPLADMIIASLAIENNLTLVTKDKHFKGIDELKLILI